MAISNITTSTSVNDLMETILSDMIDSYARPAVVFPQLFRTGNIDPNSNETAYKWPRWASLAAAAVDEDTDLAYTEHTTDSATATVGQIGVIVLPTDVSGGQSRMAEHAKECAAAVADKVDTDCGALMASLTNESNLTSANLTVAGLRAAIYTMKTLNAVKPGERRVGVLDPLQIHDIGTDMIDNKGTFFGPGAGVQTVEGKLFSNDGTGYCGPAFGIDWYESNNIPAGDTGTDLAGAIFVANKTFGIATKWLSRAEMQRDASARATEIVVTSCYGVVVVLNDTGVAIVSSATN